MQLYIPSHLNEQQVQSILSVLPASRNKDYKKSADVLVDANTFTLPPFGMVTYTDGVDWDDPRSRSYSRLLHGHSFLGCLAMAYADTGERAYVTRAMELIRSWAERHSYEYHKGTMAYHDETTALRLQYWLRFYITAGAALTEVERIFMLAEMKKTAALLAEDSFHATGTNHGMFQDVALLLYAFYFEEERSASYQTLAVQRLRDYFSGVFTEDGVHKEQSPSYHMLVAANVKMLATLLEPINEEVCDIFQTIFRQTERFATYIIRPDGCLPPICDTESTAVYRTTYRTLYDSDDYKYAVTAGTEGSTPSDADAVFPEAGYAIFRDDWAKKKNAAYVLFTAAYNADYHKHSDDLNVYIYRGGEIISEAGPHGYNYKDPYTKHAYSSFAHNTLVVDGKGLPRTDQKFDQVYMSGYSIGEHESEATGVNARYEGVRHERSVKYVKNEQRVIVRDTISSDKRHEYKLFWHVAPNIQVHVRDRCAELFRGNEKVMELFFSTEARIRVRCVKEQMHPYVQGFTFPKMEAQQPSSCIEVELSGSDVQCTTEFRMEAFQIGKEGKLPFAMETQYDSTRSVRYSFEAAEDESVKDQLIVVFSAMSPVHSFVYNYGRTLDHVKANKLFILDDFGDQGSYYLGYHRDHAIETSIASLIQYIMAKCGVSHRNVTVIGSSKGGYAALYFGIKYYFGHVIAGGPQSKIGHFLVNQANHPNVAAYIAGGTDEGDVHYLDGLLYSLLEQPHDISPHIHIMVGTADHHYKNHVIPLYDTLRRKGYHIHLDVKDGLTHNDLRTHFPPYVQDRVAHILGKPNVQPPNGPVVSAVSVNQKSENSVVVTCKAQGETLQYAYYILHNDTVVEKKPYQNKSDLHYVLTEPGNYKFRVFVRDHQKRVTALTSHTFKYSK